MLHSTLKSVGCFLRSSCISQEATLKTICVERASGRDADRDKTQDMTSKLKISSFFVLCLSPHPTVIQIMAQCGIRFGNKPHDKQTYAKAAENASLRQKYKRQHCLVQAWLKPLRLLDRLFHNHLQKSRVGSQYTSVDIFARVCLVLKEISNLPKYKIQLSVIKNPNINSQFSLKGKLSTPM